MSFHTLFSSFAAGVLSLVQMAPAQDPAAPAAPLVREVQPGHFEIGKVRLDKKARTVTLPAKLNMTNGALEYLLVRPEGSAHESLLVSSVEPSEVHLAMLLLGAKGAGILAPAPTDAPPPQLNSEYLKTAPKLQGDQIRLSVKWTKAGKPLSAPVDAWIRNSTTGKPAKEGPWIYTGSMFSGEHFLAQSEGVFAAVVTNPSALINNPREGSNNDQVWEVNENAVPAVDTPVELVIHLDTPVERERAEPTK
jgi:hypothetical protein